ncbi:DNA replication/repair protein RecF [Canibacter zhoujuaniae]|uniref:DNA replication/repair protein RecF n=1 Tax=Canibacter zhoujuaniae TaxID=2708343 RepID=UPI0014200053|nr:DNA replication/repair protein RecF [Canibacter zhoujuaniae]
MWIKRLELHNFRNYENLEVEFDAGKVLILGHNGQGKTNLIEGIAYFDSLSSHRVSSDAPLLKAGENTGVLRVIVAHTGSTKAMDVQLQSGRGKKAQLNGNSIAPRELTRYLTTVVFAPEDLQIVRGEPSARRSFLDSAIVSRNPIFAGVLQEYERVVKQRSSLLRAIRGNPHQSGFRENLEFWNSHLLLLGTRVMAERRRLVDDLLPYLKEAYKGLVGADHRPGLALYETATAKESRPYVAGAYAGVDGSEVFDHLSNVSRETLSADFKFQLDRLERAEIERGQTLIGPHRDDLQLELNGLPVKGYASHGESWSVALSLKLAIAELMRAELNSEDPVLILDDVFAELDAKRRESLMTAVGDYEQVIITAAVAADIPPGMPWQTFIISGGRLVKSEVSADPQTVFAKAGVE